jgi:hypothetical protein
MSIFLKSLSGNITTLSLNSLKSEENEDFKEFKESDSLSNIWYKIRNIISEENDCDYSQVIFIEENEEKINEIPDITNQKIINFFIREKDYLIKNFSVSLKFFDVSYCYDCYDEDSRGKDIYNKYIIQIYERNECFQTFYVYHNESLNKFYHQDTIISSGIDSNISIKFGEEGETSIYPILCKNIYVPWYDKSEIIDRIMTQFDYIMNYIMKSNDYDQDNYDNYNEYENNYDNYNEYENNYNDCNYD